MTDRIRVGTRGSALALAQSGLVARDLARSAGLETELVTVTTQGDTSRANLASLGGTGVFATELRTALLAGEVDVIVHSLKDLPTKPFDGLVIAATPKRADARDVLVARDGLSLAELPEGARIGTGSPRRIAELKALRPDLEVVADFRGNIDSRIGKVASGDVDAVILAAAGLDRLGKADAVSERFSLSAWPTAPGQGALALEVRAEQASDATAFSRALLNGVTKLDHATTRATVRAERDVLAGLEAGCAAPVATTAIVDDGMLFLTATVYALDGSRSITASHAAVLDSSSAIDLLAAASEVAGRTVAELLEAGAKDLA
ncbi:hydroxymethylbilane synthase [Gryllotalpicola protaetiae]|uniref:Porphobilinogen deaminase n=1 Tax=Gryllotalpicola protaetiae TaxID=2419771 RepID=A0A387BI00_9MICO|nr:hydroxymethylbilane synthase [Gryllotalpicola protaetiae]AYG03675.1 hydroxymethylbilane synthase [Gryllotalpicola protaetiae]